MLGEFDLCLFLEGAATVPFVDKPTVWGLGIGVVKLCHGRETQVDAGGVENDDVFDDDQDGLGVDG